MLTDNAMQSMKNFVMGTVAYAQLNVNGELRRFDIHNRYIDGAAVKIDVLLDSYNYPGAVALTEIQLYDIAGELWLSKPVDLAKEGISEGIFCRITLTFKERMEE